VKHIIDTVTVDTFEGNTIWDCDKGYPTIFIDGKNIKVHVYVWERANGPKPKGTDVHHIDENKQNYSLDNLELLSKSDHMKLHAGWIRTNGEWTHKACTKCKIILPISEFYQRNGYPPFSICKPCARDANYAWVAKNKDQKKKYARNWLHRKRGEPEEAL
jgi:hypothetical protein